MMSCTLVAVVGLLLAGGPTREPPPDLVVSPVSREPVVMRVVFDERQGRQLVGYQRAPAETTPPACGYRLSERGPHGERHLADRVGAARWASDGALLMVQDHALVEVNGKGRRLITEPVLPDFDVDPAGRFIAIVRPGAEGTALELISRDGALEHRVAPARGWNGSPIFAADGSLAFVSGRTGVASIFWLPDAVEGGQDLRQVTNAEVRPVPEGFGRSFVPPPNGRERLRFVEPLVLEYDAGEGELWRVDLKSGAASRAGDLR